MIRTSARTAALASLALFTACSSSSSLTDDAGTDDALAALERDTGRSWTVRWHPDLHTPAYLQGRTAPLAATPGDAERAGRAFLTQYRALFRMSAPDDELDAVESLTDEVGMTHARFSQRQDGVPVWDGDLIVHFADDGAIVCVNGRYQPVPSMSAVPSRSSDEARVAAVEDARAARPEVDANAFSTLAPKLWIYPTSPTDARLAWRVETVIEDAVQPQRFETFVDAADGSILHRTDTLMHLEGSGVGVFGDRKQFQIAQRRGSYWLEDATRGTPAQKVYTAAYKSHLPGTELKSSDPDAWDETGDGHGSAVDAQVYVAAAWDYFATVHGRRGWNADGKGVHASVHFGKAYSNAFFDVSRLVFGDGDGKTFSPLAGAVDVVAHEFTHGVTYRTAHLRGEYESGALNEAVSDIFGTFVAHRERAGHEWKIGEAIYHPHGHAAPLRDLVRPHQTGNPSNMSEYVDTMDDFGGVHTNCTIPGRAAYLMTAGPGNIGWDASGRIWYRALRRYLTSRATFADAADATIRAAKDLKLDAGAVRQAWVAVGVLSE
jgi:bacillolysin